jgi:serine/threonine protein kinase
MAEDRFETAGHILGHYRLTRRLGQGGFAEVYLGEHIHLHTLAAIKVLHTRLADEAVREFQQEAQLIARLQHPNIVRVLDFGVEGGVPYLVMDYASNGTVRTLYPAGRSVPPASIVSFTRQIGEALYYAHEQRLVHRDIKPENILIGNRQELLLSDFGIAVALQSSHLQSTQNIAGTIAYMAPEQIEAHPSPASDQYSLAVVVYEWLCGQRPFQGSYTEIAVKHSLMAPPPLHLLVPGLPEGVERVVMTALQKQPQQRFPSVRAFAEALAEAAVQSSVSQQYIVTQIKSSAFVPSSSPSYIPPTMIMPPSMSGSPHSTPLYTSPLSMNTPGPIGLEKDSSTFVPPQKQRTFSRRGFLIGGLAGGVIGLAAVGGIIAEPLLVQQQAAKKAVQTILTRDTSGQIQQASPVLSYTQQKGLIWLARWSPDGRYIASGSMDNTAKVWAADSGQTRLSVVSKVQPARADDYPWSLAWSSKKQFLAVGFVDGTIQVLGLQGEATQPALTNPAAPLALVAWSPDEQYMAVGSGSAVLIYRYPDWSVVTTYQGHTDTVKALAWSPDGRYLASGSADTQVRVWEPLSGQIVLLYTEHTSDIASLCWSPNSTRVVSTAHDQTARVWELSTKQTKYTYTSTSGAPMGEARWSHNGQRIALYNGDAKIDILDATSGKVVYTLSSGVSYGLDWSPDDTRLVTANYDNTTRIWKVPG